MKIQRSWKFSWMVFLLASPGWAQVTQRISVSTTGVEGNGMSQATFVSAD